MQPPAPVVSATVQKCLPASAAAPGSVTFAGQMLTLQGASKMAIRVELEERASAPERFHPLAAPGLGVWHESEPSVKIFRYLAQVTDLAAPASYRALVSFRWLNPKGRTIRRLARHTPACRQAAPQAVSGPSTPANMGSS